MRNKNLTWLGLVLIVVALDQWTKSLTASHLALGQPYQLTPFLNFTLAQNSGAAFSFLSQAGGWQRWFFIILTGVVCIILLIWIFRLPKNQPLTACALSLILGGAVGNLWDRVYFGFVHDFVDFHLGYWHFATFNIADTAITFGVILLLLDMFILRKK